MSNTINGYRPIKNTKTSFGSFGPQAEALLTKPEVAREIAKTKGLTKLLPKLKNSELIFDVSSDMVTQSSSRSLNGTYFHRVFGTEPTHKLKTLIHEVAYNHYETYFQRNPDFVCKSLKMFDSMCIKHAQLSKQGAKTEKRIAALDIKIKSLQESIDTATEEVKKNAIETVKNVINKGVGSKSKKVSTEAQIKKMEKQLEKQQSKREKLSDQATRELLKNEWVDNFSIDHPKKKKNLGTILLDFLDSFVPDWEN